MTRLVLDTNAVVADLLGSGHGVGFSNKRTTDDRLIKKMREVGGLRVMLPGEALAFLENWYEN